MDHRHELCVQEGLGGNTSDGEVDQAILKSSPIKSHVRLKNLPRQTAYAISPRWSNVALLEYQLTAAYVQLSISFLQQQTL